MKQQQFDLSFILLIQYPSQLETFLKAKKIPCRTFYYSGKKDFPRLLLQVYLQLRREKTDAVHCHLIYGSLIGLTAARLAGIKRRIYTRHHSDYHQRYFPKGLKWDKWCNRMATDIVAPSAVVKEVLLEMEKVPAEKVKVIHHGFDFTYFNEVTEERVHSLREKYKTAGHYPVVGVIARFTELKGIQYIIPAFERLLKTYPNALLLLFNAVGNYEHEIRRMLKAIPEQNYRTIPFENDLAAVYKLFDVFIQASTDRTIESFGQTYVEALVSGVPSVFTLAGIASDFIKDEHNAYVVSFKDSKAIYEKMMQILLDLTKAKTIAERGAKNVQELFSLEKMIYSLENLYDNR